MFSETSGEEEKEAEQFNQALFSKRPSLLRKQVTKALKKRAAKP